MGVGSRTFTLSMRNNRQSHKRASCTAKSLIFVGLFLAFIISRTASISQSLPPRGAIVPMEGKGDHTPGGFDAIIVPAGGQTPDGPPDHVMRRLEKAIELSHAYPDAKIIVTARGTPHKPCPKDEAEFERPEASDNARVLMERGGVDPSRILEEAMSLETVGNAFFARIMHTDIRGLRRLAVINNTWHMPRTKAVFEHVFAVSTNPGDNPGYELTFFEVEAALPPDVLKVRLEREAKALPKFDVGGEWRKATPTLLALHDWVFRENTAYASKRLKEEREKVDPKTLNSY